MGILQYLLPKDRKFFPLFKQATENLVKGSKLLVELVNAPVEKRRELIKEIEHVEHTGDNITHMIFNELGRNFITPFDREDIHALTSSIDDVLDLIQGSAKRIELYKVTVISDPMVLLSDIILKGAIELNVAVVNLEGMKRIDEIKAACVRINSLENNADDVFNLAIAKLFDEEKDAIQLIKTKEILQALETATDKCEDAANVIESIIIKYA
ncbi:MAG: phosphate transport regulator [Flavobacteriales bacterium]|nr:MAG: phosphate transport regulator [Flavobacteriales bacterium]